MNKAALCCSVYCTVSLAAFAQNEAARPIFDVAAIKPSSPEARGSSLNFQPPNGVRVTNMSVKALITFAYDVRDFQVSGGPGWVESQHFDIMAKGEPSPTTADLPSDPRKMTDQQRNLKMAEMRARLRALLEDRFKLQVHREIKEGQVYALVTGKSGSKLTPSAEGNEGRQGTSTGRGQITGYRAPIQMLVEALSAHLGRPVFDKTELAAKYDWKLQWTPESREAGTPSATPAGGEASTPSAPEGPTLFTALQEQLGLRLESRKGPIETLVVDRVDQPSEN
jgi:uncharacterized protein (TIGR03435 family)